MRTRNKDGGCTTALGVFIFIIIIIIAILGGAYVWYNQQIGNPRDPNAQPVTFTVQSGESTSTIASKLFDSGLINSKEALLVYLRLNNLGGAIKAGDFKLSAANNTEEIIKQLTKSPLRETAWITIKEGLRFTEIVDDLRTQLVDTNVKLDYDILQDMMANPDNHLGEFNQKARDFLTKYKPDGKSLEGFLYPDTYNISTTITEPELVSLLVNTLGDKLTAADYAAIAANSRPFYDIIRVASIVEREANNQVDYPIVAGVFYNRLKMGTVLGSDVTVLYGLNRWKPEPTASELRNRSNLYNTRILAGLPPTPICNPGIATIRASISPADTGYIYFFAGSDGKMYYGKTLAEHNRNIRDHS